MGLGFIEILDKRVVLFDGGMGSLLIAAGLGEGEIPEKWNFDHPSRMLDIHRAYLEAGAEVIQTNTFGATAVKLSASAAGKAMDARDVNLRGAALAREAVEKFGGEERFVAGDIGPTGMFFPPMGRLTPDAARDAFREQARALEEGGVDIFLIETMYDIREAAEALAAVREVSGKPAVVELTFDLKPKGYFTLLGDTPEKVAGALPSLGADVIGANCTLASDGMIGLAREFRRLTGAPVLIQPNAGKPEIRGGKPFYSQTPEEFADDVEEILSAGINAVGGCCGTTPDFIAAVRARLDRAGRLRED